MSVSGDAQAEVDLVDAVKRVHRSFPSGVTIVTTSIDGQPFGLAVNAFSSVTLGPPMVLVCINESSSTYPKFFASNTFGISILAHDQEPVARRFATSGGDKFADIAWHNGTAGLPLVDGASAHLELDIVSMLPSGTHTIFIGRVTTAIDSGKPPLIYFDGSFFDGGRLVPAAANDGE